MKRKEEKERNKIGNIREGHFVQEDHEGNLIVCNGTLAQYSVLKDGMSDNRMSDGGT